MDNRHIKFYAFFIFIVLNSIMGCVSYVKPADQKMCDTKFPFIEDGKTAKADVLQNIDIKDLRYKNKNEKVWIYRIIFYEEKIAYDLVLVFDDNGLLKKHSWVKTW